MRADSARLTGRSWTSPTDLIGTSLGSYRVEGVLGTGLRGVSLRAWSSDGSCWRLRVTPRGTDEARIAALEAALAAFTAVGHPRVRVPALVRTGSERLLVEPWIESDSFEAAWSLGDPSLAARALLQVLDALAGLHAAGVAHGAVHPANVRLGLSSVRPEVFLVDPGVDRLEAERWVPGAPAAQDDLLRALAPEQRLGLRGDPRSDVFAYGWLLLDLMAATRSTGPFVRPPVEPQLAEPWRGRGLESLLASLLEFDPSARASNLASVRARIESALAPVAGEETPTLSDPCETWTEKLVQDPGDARALRELVALGTDPSLVEQVVEGLVLAADSLTELPVAGAPAAQQRVAELLLSAAKLWLRHHPDDGLALDLLAKATRADPQAASAAEVLATVERLSVALGQLEPLVDVLIALADAAPTQAERAALLARVGAVFETRLEDPQQALLAYVEALAAAPQDELCRASVQRLVGDDGGALTEVVNRCLRITPSLDGPDRTAMARFLAELCGSRRELAPVAAASYGEIVRLEPTDLSAWRGLVDVLRREARNGAPLWKDLGAALLELSQREPERTAAAAALVEAAEILELELGDLPSARDLLRQALDRDPESVTAVAAMARVAERIQDHRSLVDALEKQLATAPPEERAARCVRIAEVWTKQLGEPEKALTHLATALYAAPRDRAALELHALG